MSNKADSTEDRGAGPQNVLEPPYDLALRLGFTSYSKFAEKLAQEFKRVTADERERFTRNIYRFAAGKFLRERARTDVANQANEMLQESRKIQSALRDIDKAMQNLSAAIDTLPEGSKVSDSLKQIVYLLDDIRHSQTKMQQDLARFAQELPQLAREGREITMRGDSPSSIMYTVAIRKIQEIAPELPNEEERRQSAIDSLTNPNKEPEYGFRFSFKGRPLTALDHWLIAKIYQYLPRPPSGKRSRFDRDEVIVTTFGAAFGETLGKEGVRSARRRSPKSSV
jgi:hypothetical protein